MIKEAKRAVTFGRQPDLQAHCVALRHRHGQRGCHCGERSLGQPKGKAYTRRLPTVVFEALRRHDTRQQEERRLAAAKWIGDGAYVFTSSIGTPLEPRRRDKIFHDLREKAGLRRIRFHDLRHSAASILIAQGVHPKAIQERLRNSSIQLTMDTYGHLFEQVQRETADKMDAILAVEKSEKNGSIVVKHRLVRFK